MLSVKMGRFLCSSVALFILAPVTFCRKIFAAPFYPAGNRSVATPISVAAYYVI